MERLNQQGLNLTLALQRLPALNGLMRVASLFGEDSFFMFLIAVSYWWLDAALSAHLAVALVASTALAGLLKLVFHQPRPYWLDPGVRALSRSHDYGLPSRHVLNATLTFGILLGRIPAHWLPLAVAVVLILIALVALSRVYIGVHFPMDVGVGLGIGLLGLWADWVWSAGLWAGWSGLDPWPQIGLALAASVTYLGLVQVVLAAIARTPDPAAWLKTASAGRTKPLLSPRNFGYHAATAGGMLGLGIAFALMARWPQPGVAVSGGAVLGRLAVGLIGAMALWFGLEKVPRDKNHWLSHAYGYLQHALVVLWLFFLAPVVFGIFKI